MRLINDDSPKAPWVRCGHWLPWLIGIAAGAILHWMMAYGPGVVPDSTIYIEAARSAAAGNGIATAEGPVTHYPPFYALLLAAVGPGELVDTGGARILHAVLFGLTFVLLIRAARAHDDARVNLVAMSIMAVALLTSGPLILVWGTAVSEAPFLPLLFGAFIAFEAYQRRGQASALVASGILLGCACATRYAGIFLLPPLAIALVRFRGPSFRHRMRDLVVFTTLTVLPTAAWMLRNVMLTSNAANRAMVLHLPRPKHLGQIIESVSTLTWGIPGPLAVQAASTAVVMVLIIGSQRRVLTMPRTAQLALARLCVSAFWWYVVLLLVSVSVFDAATPLNPRILAPAYIAGLVVLTAVLAPFLCRLPRSRLRTVTVALLVAAAAFRGVRAAADVRWVHRNGQGYSGQDWRASETMERVGSGGGAVRLYSHAADAIRFMTARPAARVPRPYNATSLEPNPDFDAQVDSLCEAIRLGTAQAVFFDGETRDGHLSADGLRARCPGLREVIYSDGRVFIR